MNFRIFGAVLLFAGGASLVGLLLVSVSDALLRATGTPFIGAKEISETFLSICVAVALPVSVYFGKAVSVDGIVTVLPKSVGRAITVCGEVLAALLCAVLAYQLIKAGADAADFEEKSALLKIPYVYMYQIMATGFGLTVPAFAVRAWISYHSEPLT